MKNALINLVASSVKTTEVNPMNSRPTDNYATENTDNSHVRDITATNVNQLKNGSITQFELKKDLTLLPFWRE
jgi:hypothetical protein